MTDLPQPLLHCGYQAPGPNKFARPESGYTADQMREYGALCRKAALEEAAKFCESQQVNHSPRGGTRMFRPFNSECMGTHEGIYYAKAIRELIK